MSSYTIQLPAGTNVTHLVNLPHCGSWLGAVSFSISSVTDATIHSLLIEYDTAVTLRWYRRVGGTQAGNWQNWTLSAQRRIWFPMFNNEMMTIINYTSTNPISLCVETNRNVRPKAHTGTVGIPYGNATYGTQYKA